MSNYASGSYRKRTGQTERQEQQEQVKQAKLDLLAKMKTKQQNSTKRQPKGTKVKPINETTDTGELKRLQQQVASLKLALKKEKNKGAEERKKNRQLKAEMKGLYQRYDEEVKALQGEMRQTKRLSLRQKAEAEGLRQYLQRLGWQEGNEATQELQRRNALINFLLSQERGHQKFRNGEQQREIKWRREVNYFKEKLGQLEVEQERGAKERFQLQEQLQVAKRQVHQLQQRNRVLAQEKQRQAAPQDLIFKLLQQLDTKSFPQFNQLNKLFEQYQFLLRYQMTYASLKNSEVLYGFLEVQSPQELYFHDINEEISLPVRVLTNFKRRDLLTDGLAIQVYRKLEKPEEVILGYCYPIMDRKEKSKGRERKARLGNKEMLLEALANDSVKEWARQLRVTVVGNKRTQNFAQQLAKVVSEVQLIDTYEKGETRTFQLLRSSDYAFILTDSVPHSVMDFLKGNPTVAEKSQLFYNPGKDDGVVRLNYLYWTAQQEVKLVEKNSQ